MGPRKRWKLIGHWNWGRGWCRQQAPQRVRAANAPHAFLRSLQLALARWGWRAGASSLAQLSSVIGVLGLGLWGPGRLTCSCLLSLTGLSSSQKGFCPPAPERQVQCLANNVRVHH